MITQDEFNPFFKNVFSTTLERTNATLNLNNRSRLDSNQWKTYIVSKASHLISKVAHAFTYRKITDAK